MPACGHRKDVRVPETRRKGDTPPIEEMTSALEAFARTTIGSLAIAEVVDKLAPLLSLDCVRVRAVDSSDEARYLALDDLLDDLLQTMSRSEKRTALRDLYGFAVYDRPLTSPERRIDGIEARGARAAETLGYAGWRSLQRRTEPKLHTMVARLLYAVPPSIQEPDLEGVLRLKDDINDAFEGFAVFHDLLRDEPFLVDKGRFEPDDPDENLRSTIVRLRDELAHNEAIAFIGQVPGINRKRPILEVRSADYATLRALGIASAASGDRAIDIYALGAYSVGIDTIRDDVLLVRRKAGVNHWSGAIATPGGLVGRVGDGMPHAYDEGVGSTIRRELVEELGPFRSWREPVAYAFTEDSKVGRLQVVGIGAVGEHDEDEPTDLLESSVERVLVADLPERLLEGEQWIPATRMHVLIWLLAGAPGVESDRLTYNPQLAAESIVQHIGDLRDHRCL